MLDFIKVWSQNVSSMSFGDFIMLNIFVLVVSLSIDAIFYYGETYFNKPHKNKFYDILNFCLVFIIYEFGIYLHN